MNAPNITCTGWRMVFKTSSMSFDSSNTFWRMKFKVETGDQPGMITKGWVSQALSPSSPESGGGSSAGQGNCGQGLWVIPPQRLEARQVRGRRFGRVWCKVPDKVPVKSNLAFVLWHRIESWIVLGEVEKISFIASSGKRDHSELMPSRLFVPSQRR